MDLAFWKGSADGSIDERGEVADPCEYLLADENIDLIDALLKFLDSLRLSNKQYLYKQCVLVQAGKYDRQVTMIARASA